MVENKHSFRARLIPHFAPKDQLDIHLAYALAKFGHRAQLRKELVEGKPTRYFEHVRRAALILMDELKIMDKNLIISALLHDCLEDTEDITSEMIEHCFGTEVISIVKCLSKVPKEGYIERLSNCSDGRILLVKGCDKLDNLRSLIVPGTTLEFQKKQIKETKEKYYPLFDKLLDMLPQYKSATLLLRDEIRAAVERCSVLIDLEEKRIQKQEKDEGPCPTCLSYPRRGSCPIKCQDY